MTNLNTYPLKREILTKYKKLSGWTHTLKVHSGTKGRSKVGCIGLTPS